LANAQAGIALWVDGEPVSMAGFSGPTPHGIRIGPVYTPPERRRRGYASALVAALSAKLLAEGRDYCFLYTDLANPTSNKIYTDVGYEHVCESVELVFDEPL
jgi:predicted GNAT family acetyltransferase